MRTYDIRCPYCNRMNRRLDLQETDGLMECENCLRIVKVFDKVLKVEFPELLMAYVKPESALMTY